MRLIGMRSEECFRNAVTLKRLDQDHFQIVVTFVRFESNTMTTKFPTGIASSAFAGRSV